MKLYRTRLNLGSASLSHWQADTVFGHLCWSLVRRRGEGALREFLARFEGEERDPPVLVSDGFPDAYLPRPLHRFGPAAQAAAISKLQRIQSAQQRKQQAGANWLTLEDFNRARNGLAPEQPLTDAGIAQALHIHVQPKNQIDRLTGTTGADAGQLYELTEIVMPVVTLYWKIAGDHTVEQPHAEIEAGVLVISQFDYFRIIARRQRMLDSFMSDFNQSCVLFIGYSFHDMDISAHLHRVRRERRGPKWYAVFPRDDDDVRRMYEQEYGILQINRTFHDFMADLDAEVNFIPRDWKRDRIARLVKAGKIAGPAPAI